MERWLFKIVVGSCLILSVASFGIDYNQITDNQRSDDDQDRGLVIPILLANANNLGLNNLNNLFNNTLLPLLALAALASLIPLLAALAAGALALALHSGGNDSYGYDGGYSEYKRALGLDDLDWERLSFLDWLSIGEETFRTFDPSNLECQKRFVCEVHQNVNKFGHLAENFVSLFQMLEYTKVFALPEVIEALLEEYEDAADRGRTMLKECSEVYPHCDFSVKKMVDKYSLNEIK